MQNTALVISHNSLLQSHLCGGFSFSPGIVQGGALSSICTQIMTTVDQEQNKALWIPAGPL